MEHFILFLETLSHYTREPEPEAIRLQNLAVQCLSGTLLLQSPYEKVIVSTDYRRDVDDLALALVLFKASGDFTFVVSEPAHDRLALLKRTCVDFKDAQFGHRTGPILFLPDSVDGVLLTDTYDLYLNCGPVTDATLVNIRAALTDPATIFTVGANPDGTKSVPPGINQKSANWDAIMATVPRRRNLSPSLSRYVLLPNPDTIPVSAEIKEEMLATLCTMVVSRPARGKGEEPPYADRFNDANSVLVAQHIAELNLADKMTLNDPDMRRGLQTYAAYAAHVAHCDPKKAIVPIVVTCLLGGEYLPDVYGFPTSHPLKNALPCLTPDSARRVIARLSKLSRYSPAYDLTAAILAFNY